MKTDDEQRKSAALERIKNYKVPCGQVMGHGDYCCEGHLCGKCKDVVALREEEESPIIIARAAPIPVGYEKNVADSMRNGPDEDGKVADAALERFKQRVAEKVKEAQPREIIFTRDVYPPIGHEFAISWTGEDGKPVQKIIRLSYVNEGKRRMSFEIVQ